MELRVGPRRQCDALDKRTPLKLSCHRTGTVTVVFPQTNTIATRTLTMGQSYPLIRPGPGANPPIYPPFLAPARRGLPEGRIPQKRSLYIYYHRFAETRTMCEKKGKFELLKDITCKSAPSSMFSPSYAISKDLCTDAICYV